MFDHHSKRAINPTSDLAGRVSRATRMGQPKSLPGCRSACPKDYHSEKGRKVKAADHPRTKLHMYRGRRQAQDLKCSSAAKTWSAKWTDCAAPVSTPPCWRRRSVLAFHPPASGRVETRRRPFCLADDPSPLAGTMVNPFGCMFFGRPPIVDTPKNFRHSGKRLPTETKNQALAGLFPSPCNFFSVIQVGRRITLSRAENGAGSVRLPVPLFRAQS